MARRKLCALAGALFALGVPLLAQAQGGTITGAVTEAQSGVGVGSAQVFIADLDLGVITQANGAFTLANVPAGTYDVTVQRLGFQTATAQVTVTAGQTTNQSFEISQQALALDELVVTGTAGGSQRRAIGNVVGSVSAAEVTEVAPIVGVENLLQGREAGLSVLSSGGDVAASGSGIRIRGTSSISLSSQPLIYVDGVRVNNDNQAGPDAHGGTMISVLNDFNPNDIENIEVIKGPAAATLYGTEASSGVINITTKRGQAGAPQFDLSVRMGTNWLHDPSGSFPRTYSPDGGPNGGPIREFCLMCLEEQAGTSPFRYGAMQTYNLGLRGGTDVLRYFASAEWNSEDGFVNWNYANRYAVRTNLTLIPTENWTFDTNIGYTNGEQSLGQQRDAYGVMEQILWADGRLRDTRTRGYLRATPEAIQTIEAIREYGRLTAGLTTTHNPFDWFTHKLTFGIDRSDETSHVLVPKHPEGSGYFFGSASEGLKEVWLPVNDQITLDYGASVIWDYSDNIRLTSSAGAQYYSTSREEVFTTASNFAAPVLTTLSSGVPGAVQETVVQNKSFGLYFQQEVGINNRIFLTGAVRGDDNSAFGSDYDAAIYPKFSGTWVMSEEAFWNLDFVNNFRIRGAWGKAGKQPGTFAALQLFAPGVGPGGAGVVAPRTIGNPDLGPEVSEELEVGFDASFFDDRFSTIFTYYTGTTKDAIYDVNISPSLGYQGNRQVNIAQVSSNGFEVQLDATVLQRENLSWNLGVSFAQNSNNVDDLGELGDDLGGSTGLREGYPFPAIWGKRIWRDPKTKEPAVTINQTTGAAQNIMCDGGTGHRGRMPGGVAVPCGDAPYLYFPGRILPEYDVGLTSSIGIGDNLRISTLFDLRLGGHFNTRDLCTVYGFGTTAQHIQTPAERQADYESRVFFASLATSGVQRWGCDVSTDFGKFRDITATYSVPQGWADRIGASRAQIQLGVRNLPETYQRYREDHWGRAVLSPDRRRTTDIGNENTSTQRANFPPATSVVATVRVSF